ncbi:unnamed protein product [Fraxinus pennsylvanica]|uniref:DUF4283 domain-containing protein n=1 Tax=Fraxinus pennsylvanica TaxID=56036 RepID=A0AAD2AG37_9LAMI|nr:unnamed protein product [Fraxinus pennsylvanica]
MVATTQLGSTPPLDPGHTSVQQGGSFLDVARLSNGISTKLVPIPMKNPTLINGQMGFVFIDQETKKLADDLRFTLVIKFLTTRPNIDELRREVVKTWGLKEVPTISFMDEFHVLIQLNNETDFLHVWAREGRSLMGAKFSIFKWTPDFDMKSEPSIATQ